MELLALALQGTGLQRTERREESILEIALVPVINWHSQGPGSYTSLVNPGKPVPQRSWIPAALNDAVLANAPSLEEIEPELAAQVDGRYLVGYNLRSQWRLLHRRCPKLRPAGLIDTFQLARVIDPGHRNDLGAVIERLGLSAAVRRQAGTPRRCLWDAVASGMLLTALALPVFGPEPSISELLGIAGIPLDETARPAMLFA
jgi:DNA polymerase-3 subunit epsilon